jgi:hypothetical protein
MTIFTFGWKETDESLILLMDDSRRPIPGAKRLLRKHDR